MMSPPGSPDSAVGGSQNYSDARPDGGPEVGLEKLANPPRRPGGERDRIHSAALEAYAHERMDSAPRRGPAVRMSSTNGDENLLTFIAGSTGENILIIAAPRHADGSLADIQPGQRWVFRTVHQTTVLRFEAVVKRVVDDEAPHVYLEMSGDIERRVIRNAARVSVAMRATLLPSAVHALIVDLSVGGARFAIDAGAPLDLGRSIVCSTALNIADRLYALELKGVVLQMEAADPRHPNIHVYRMRFESLSDLAFLALQAYLSAQLVEELDYFWRLVAGR